VILACAHDRPYPSPVALAPGLHEIGPRDGDLLVQTYREGVAQKVGHDLILEVRDWKATVEVGDHGLPSSVVLEADPRSLHVRRGLRGAKPLTDSDRASIRENIARRVLREPPIRFRSDSIDASATNLTVSGELTVAGARRPASFAVAVGGDGRLRGTLPVRQSDWGITPYRALMGALRVRDTVEVVIDVAVPAA
jgi:polyisoprenoid-binding protein YceI